MLRSIQKVVLLEAALLVAVSAAIAKPVLRAKVYGPAFTVHAKSGKACFHLCEKQDACDSANFEIPTGKCKLFSRCSPILMLANSTAHIHFAKRPLIREAGWTYHKESDSCLRLLERLTDYSGADRLCAEQGGRLASLSGRDINSLATDLLRSSAAQYAWIGLTDSRFEGNPIHTDGRRVEETGWFPVDGQSLRKDPRRNCWSLSDAGTWVEHHCKTREQYSICQITPF